MMEWLLLTMLAVQIRIFGAVPALTSEPTSDPSPNTTLPADCSQPIIQGNCMAYIEKYGYNEKTGKCEKFIFGGCGGNHNQFDSEEECKNTCKIQDVK
ncbi:unnamed protein product [Dicrocoelium dendriticum]|nr:unnamed protein product [Dicrocoelium dendriticum]